MLYMNLIEVILLSLSLILLFFVALKNTKSISISILLSALLVPALFLSIEGMSQFVTTDENYIVMESVDLQNSDMKQWYYGAYRTSDTVVGTLLNLFQRHTYIGKIGIDLNELKILAKVLHWFFGFLIIIAIYQLINKHYISEKRKLHYFVIYFYSVLLLPLNILALKIASYNLYSMLFAVLTLVLLLIAFKTKNEKYALLGIICGTLAAQEKLIASPFLVLAIISFVYMKLSNTRNINYYTSLCYSIYSMFIVFLVSITSFLIVAMVVREGSIPNISLSAVMGILVGYLSPIIRVIRGGAFQEYSVVYALLFTLSLLSFVPIYIFKINSWPIIIRFFQFIQNNIRVITTVTILSVLSIGIIGTYFIDIFLYPYYPVSNGNYLSSYMWAGFIIHFDAKDFFVHTISYIAAMYGFFINTIPSVYLIILFLLLWNQQTEQKYSNLSTWRIILLLILSIPFFYAMANIPMENNYFNIFTFIVILIVGLEFNKVLNYYDRFISSILVSLFAIFLIIEVLPFRPIIGFFLPIWNQPNIEQYNNLEPGQTYVGWWASGEEAFLVGKQIEKMVLTGKISNINTINIYGGHDWIFTGSTAEWPTKPNFIKTHYPARQFKNRRYTKSDYYMITRRAIVEGYILPDELEPFLTLSYRGLIQVWVYRGDQLKSYCHNRKRKSDYKLKQGQRYSPCTNF